MVTDTESPGARRGPRDDNGATEAVMQVLRAPRGFGRLLSRAHRYGRYGWFRPRSRHDYSAASPDPRKTETRGAAEERAKGPQGKKELTEAEKTLAKARQALKENKTPEAQRELEHLVELEPGNASAWYELGRIYEQQGRRADAAKSYTSAIAADATLVGPYAMLAGLQAQDQQWKELAETTGRLIRINPVDVPAAYFYKAVANYNLGDLDEAEKAARQGIQIDTQHQVPRLHHMLGSILADGRNFAEAAEQMKLYVQYAPAAKDRDDALKLADEWARQ